MGKQKRSEQHRHDAFADAIRRLGPQVVKVGNLHSRVRISEELAGLFPKIGKGWGVLIVRRQEAPCAIAILSMQARGTEQGLIEAALVRVSRNTEILFFLMVEHAVEQVAASFDAVA